MTINREVVLSVSVERARQQLTAGFATPLVVQRGNLFLAKIICSGRINGNDLRVRYTEYGRSITIIDLTGHIEEIPGGVRLQLTASDGLSNFLLYLPIVWVLIVFISINIKSGYTPGTLVNCLIILAFGSGILFLVRTLLLSFLQMRITKIEAVLVKLITGSEKRDFVR